MFKKLLTEPLLHFLFIAIVFFVAYDALNPEELTEQTITISEGRVEQIKNQIVESRKRAPVKNELNNAIQAYALNEMYLREARALGLDIGDASINKRLRQKMNFMLEDMASGNEATEKELKAYYDKNKELYRSPVIYSFTQAYISVDRPSDELEALLSQQKLNISKGLSPVSDSSLLPATVSQQTAAQLKRRFGQAFSAQLKLASLQKWFGPIESGMGQHFIFLTQRDKSVLKTFEQLNSREKYKVLDDWQRQNIQIYKKHYEAQLLSLYHIDVFSPLSGSKVK